MYIFELSGIINYLEDVSHAFKVARIKSNYLIRRRAAPNRSSIRVLYRNFSRRTFSAFWYKLFYVLWGITKIEIKKEEKRFPLLTARKTFFHAIILDALIRPEFVFGEA